jgi:NDP-sugar pyrophosphorylase family protein
MVETILTGPALFDLNQTMAGAIFDGTVYAWEALPRIKDFIRILAERLPADFEKIGEAIWVGKGTEIDSTVMIKGPAIIGYNCAIRHAAYIRENVIIGSEVTVGNSTELKNALLFNRVQVPHFNYVGDSILGYKAHLGAGVILSNVKSTGESVKVKTPDSVIETGLRKFGAMIGDGVEVGCNAVLNPGTVVGKGSIIYPLTSVRGVVPPNSILKNDGKIVPKR